MKEETATNDNHLSRNGATLQPECDLLLEEIIFFTKLNKESKIKSRIGQKSLLERVQTLETI